MSPADMVNGDETGYAVGLPVWVEVKPDGSVAFRVDVTEADDVDDLTDEQAHLPQQVRDAVLAGRYTVEAANADGPAATLAAAYERARGLADGEAISACEVLLDAVAAYLATLDN